MSFATFIPDPFFNRAHELAALDRACKHPGKAGQMLLLYGRRRLGKTYLLQRYFAAGVTGRKNRKLPLLLPRRTDHRPGAAVTLAEQILTALPSEGVTPEELAVSWNALLRYVTQQARSVPPKQAVSPLSSTSFPIWSSRRPGCHRSCRHGGTGRDCMPRYS